MNHASLFSGIGGFDLAASWMGWDNIFNCEKHPFCRRILRHYWPKAKSYEDIKKFNAIDYRGRIDVLSGGFPCQPFSQAGKRKGIADDRYLWPHMLRVVGEIRPTWVVGENVFGLINWEGGMVFRKVLSDLEAQGYEVWRFVLPVAGVGAPHRRSRIFFIAYAGGNGRLRNKESATVNDPGIQKGVEKGHELDALHGDGPTSYSPTEMEGQVHILKTGSSAKARFYGEYQYWDPRDPWRDFPTQRPVCGGDDGLSSELDDITFSAWRKESLKAYGNAVVPQLVWQIFRAIEQFETHAI